MGEDDTRQYEPHEYQKYITDFIVEHPRCGIFVEMGLGKTAPTLAAIEKCFKGKTLVISNKHIALNTWIDEIEKWGFNLTCTQLVMNKDRVKSTREERLSQDYNVYTINVDNLQWAINHWEFNNLILDESTLFKNPSSKRFRMIRKVRNNLDRIVLLTGTPMPRNAMDLWSQMFILDGGERLGKYITDYRTKYFYPELSGRYMVYRWGVKLGAFAEIKDKIRDVVMSLESADHLVLPERMSSNIYIDLDLVEKSKYNKFKKEFILNNEITAANSGVLCYKLLQFANGAIYKDDSKEFEEIHNGKIRALEDLVDTHIGKPLLIFYNFHHDVERIQKVVFGEVFEKAEQIKRWNRGEIPVLLVNPKSAGYGLNLQAGGSTIVWFSLTWNLADYQQANARLYRQGQKEPVVIYHLIAKGTVDEVTLKSLTEKEVNQYDLLKSMRREIVENSKTKRRNTN